MWICHSPGGLCIHKAINGDITSRYRYDNLALSLQLHTSWMSNMSTNFTTPYVNQRTGVETAYPICELELQYLVSYVMHDRRMAHMLSCYDITSI